MKARCRSAQVVAATWACCGAGSSCRHVRTVRVLVPPPPPPPPSELVSSGPVAVCLFSALTVQTVPSVITLTQPAAGSSMLSSSHHAPSGCSQCHAPSGSQCHAPSGCSQCHAPSGSQCRAPHLIVASSLSAPRVHLTNQLLPPSAREWPLARNIEHLSISFGCDVSCCLRHHAAGAYKTTAAGRCICCRSGLALSLTLLNDFILLTKSLWPCLVFLSPAAVSSHRSGAPVLVKLSVATALVHVRLTAATALVHVVPCLSLHSFVSYKFRRCARTRRINSVAALVHAVLIRLLRSYTSRVLCSVVLRSYW